MLRGFATINYWAADLAAARKRYSELLGTEPYFERAELDGRIVGPADPDYDRPLTLLFASWLPVLAVACSLVLVAWLWVTRRELQPQRAPQH